MISDSLRSPVMFWVNCSLSIHFFHLSLVVSSDGMEGGNRRCVDGPNQRQVDEKPMGLDSWNIAVRLFGEANEDLWE